jgi:hypothetical protein
VSRALCTGRAWLASSSRTSRFISAAPTHYRLSCRLKFGDISIKGTAKEQQMKLQRQQFARRGAEAAIAVAEIEAARFARLPSLRYWRPTRLRPPTAVHLGAGYDKSGPGLSSTSSSTSSGAADADSISPSLSFFTLPTALSTFHAVIFSDSKAAGGQLPMGSWRGQECCASLRFVMRSSCVAACAVSTNNLVTHAILY